MKRQRGGLDRRQFLTGASVSAWLAATHVPGFLDGASGDASASVGASGAARIRSLRLQTAAALSVMREYYEGLLELEILDQSTTELTIRAGETAITFVAAGPGRDGAPFYHFAFNIPENKLLPAREWQMKRTPLIPPYADLRDPHYPDDVVHFARWNAHSVFFWDPAGNLVEHIARHDLRNSVPGSFSSADILCASEIGLIADDVRGMAAELEETFGLPRYRRGSDQFTAVGDELGLLLVMKRGRILGFDEGRPAGVFATAAALRCERTARLAAPGLPYQLSSS